MKIAFVSQGFGRIDPPNVTGSISIWTYEVISELKDKHAIIAYEMDGPFCFSRSRQHEGAEYVYAPRWINRFTTILQSFVALLNTLFNRESREVKRPSFSSWWHNCGYILWVAWHTRREGFDIIHIHQFSQYVPIVRWFNRRSKIVLHMNCEWLTQLNETMIRRRLDDTELVIGCSDYITEKIRAKFPDIQQKVRTVYNGVHHRRFQILDSSPKCQSKRIELLFVGRVSPEKGIHVLIGAVRKLVKRYPELHLNIVGGIGSAPREFLVDLCEDPKMKELSRFYGESTGPESFYFECLKALVGPDLQEHVTFIGGAPYQEVVKFYRDADILINPSFSESFGMSLAEAMASEKPVVATRVGGMVNVVEDGVTGFLTEAGDEDGLADAISCLIGDPSLRLQMGKAGRERVLQLFTWEQVALNLEAEYRSLSIPDSVPLSERAEHVAM